MSTEAIPVDVLHAPGCDRWQAARDAVARVAAEHGLLISLTEISVTTEDQVEALRFPGSPTIRVRGRDLQPDVEEIGDFGLG